jgi:TrpR-related protein YerC/YecD
MSADRLRTPDVDLLIEALLSLRDPDEVYAFLVDVATVREIHDMAQRLAVARMLASGDHYDRVREVTGASTTTISRVSRCLNYGADGYRTVIGRAGAGGAPDDERPGE